MKRRVDITRRYRHAGLIAVAFGAVLGVAVPSTAAASPGKAGPTTTTTTTTSGGSVGGASVGVIYGSSGGASYSSGSFLAAAPGLHRIGVRSASGGIVVRVYTGQEPGSFGGSLPARCFPDRTLMVEVSTAAVASAVGFQSRHDEAYAPSGQYVGVNEGHPVGIVVAQVPKGTRRAVMRFTGGGTDTAAPLGGGWVVLASRVHGLPMPHHPVPLLTDTAPPLGELRVVDKNQRTRSLGTVSASSGFAINPSCLPGRPTAPTTPTTLPLPQPTGPPPTDQVAARRAIVAVYQVAFGTSKSAQADTGIEGGFPLDNATRAQLVKSYGDLLGKLTVRVNDFRFLSPTEAALSFDLLLRGQPITATTVGRAVLVGGQWKVARATFCTIIQRGNIRCP